MKTRPDFSKIKSFSEFSQYYWYRDELKKICKTLDIASTGMKAELNHNLEEYFNGRLTVKGLSLQLIWWPLPEKQNKQGMHPLHWEICLTYILGKNLCQI